MRDFVPSRRIPSFAGRPPEHPSARDGPRIEAVRSGKATPSLPARVGLLAIQRLSIFHSIASHIALPGPSQACARELAYVHARPTRA